MREVKFRAWDNVERRFWTLGDGGEASGDGSVQYFGNDHGVLEIGRLEVFDVGNVIKSEFTKFPVMQYTGLEDKNGIEIYEGDILSTSQLGKEPTITFVVFQDFGWYENLISGPVNYLVKCFRFTNANTLTSEVIGNKYEHPHLLEGTQ